VLIEEILSGSPVLHDDRIRAVAFKTNPHTGYRFPLHPRWKESGIMTDSGEILGWWKDGDFHREYVDGAWPVMP